MAPLAIKTWEDARRAGIVLSAPTDSCVLVGEYKGGIRRLPCAPDDGQSHGWITQRMMALYQVATLVESWRELTDSPFVARCGNLTLYTRYSLVEEGPDDMIGRNPAASCVRFYSDVYPQPHPVYANGRSSAALPLLARGEHVISACLGSPSSSNQPRVRPAIEFGLTRPDRLSQFMHRQPRWLCISPTDLNLLITGREPAV